MIRSTVVLLLMGLLLGVQSRPARAEIRALLIGSNTYKVVGIPDLEGPGNDVIEVEKLLRERGASDITVLRDEEVTRTHIETAFHALGLRAKAGDWIVLMYAGHGAQAEAAIKGVKKNDLDDFLVLPGLSLTNPDPENYVTSADLRAWLLNYIPSNVQVLQMVDACHSGTLQRKIDARAPHFRQRLAFRLRTGPDALKLTARPAPRFGPLPNAIGAAPGSQDAEYLPNVIYVSAAQDEEFAQEAPLPEAASPSHGVLTYNFLTAMSALGADGKTLVADTNQDGIVSFGEMAVYLDTQTRVMTDQQQEPSIHFASSYQDVPVFAEPAKHVTTPPPEPLKPAIYAASVKAKAILQAGASWRVADTARAADYVWDDAAGEVLGRTGDVVARDVSTLPALQGVMEKWATVEAIRPYLSERYAKIKIGPRVNGARYAPGAHVELSIIPVSPNAQPPAYVTVFNLASDGRVQVLYPLEEDGEGLMPTSGALPILTTEAIAPYGTDHVFALFTPDRPDNFRNLLTTVRDTRGSARLITGLKQTLARSGAAGGLALGELFTGPGG